VSQNSGDYVPWGEQVRELLGSATDRCFVVAPFIKTRALEYLLEVIQPDCQLVCITRWLPADVAAGVSDTEIFEIIEGRDNYELRLLDDLHAKLFAGDTACLVGSANVTLKGLGLLPRSNTELLVESSTTDDSVDAFIKLVQSRSRPATAEEARQVERLAEELRAVERRPAERDTFWFPTTTRPDRAYEWYHAATEVGHRTPVERETLRDLARAGMPPGQSKEQFYESVESKLLEITPIAAHLGAPDGEPPLGRSALEQDMKPLVTAGLVGDTEQVWNALVAWVNHFVAGLYQQPGGEFVLRRGDET
jgi:hypothetical protein